MYEPGSVNKLITISAALNTGVIVPSDVFTIPDSYRVAGTTFHDAENHATEHWTVTDILANSSNIGTIQIAQRLGRTNLLNYIHAYGLGSSHRHRLPGRIGRAAADVLVGHVDRGRADRPGHRRDRHPDARRLQHHRQRWHLRARRSWSTPPSTPKGREHLLPSASPHRVVSTTVAKEMTTMLDEVVRVGTGTAANLDPYTVAGKTGTALVPSPHGGYEARALRGQLRRLRARRRTRRSPAWS